MSLKLLGNRVLLKPLPKTLKSGAGIHYPERYVDDVKLYEVVAVGPGEWRKNKKKKMVFHPMEVKPGDKVLAELFHDHLIMEDGTRIARADYIMAVW